MATKYRNPTTGRDVRSDKDIEASYRQLADEATDKTGGAATSHLSGKQVLAIVKGIAGEGDEIDMERAQALLNAEPEHHEGDVKETNLPLPSDTDVGPSPQVLRFVKPMSADKDIGQHLTKIEDAGETIKQGPLVILLDWYRIYGATKEEARKVIAEMPVPGTKVGETNNPDRQTITIRKDNGERGSRTSSFYMELYDNWEHGRAMAMEKNLLTSKEPNKYSGKTDKWKAQEVARINSRRNTSVGKLRTAARIEFQLQAIEQMPGSKVQVEFAYEVDAEGNPTSTLRNTTKCIMIYDKAQPAMGDTLTIPSFLAIKVKDAKTPNLEGLLATRKRAPKAAATLAGNGKAFPEANEAAAFMSNFNAGLQATDWSATFVQRLNRPSESDFLVNVYEVHLELMNVFKEGSALAKRAQIERSKIVDTITAEKAA